MRGSENCCRETGFAAVVVFAFLFTFVAAFVVLNVSVFVIVFVVFAAVFVVTIFLCSGRRVRRKGRLVSGLGICC